jgi:DNA (cytosine-5)-methyltransferase 1
MNVLSLCTGGGGLDLGIKLAVPAATAVGYCERDACALEVLAARMEDGSLEPAPIWLDLATFDGRALVGRVDLVVAGYPCQPDSLAGNRGGADDERWLWHHVWRVVREAGSSYLFVENVPGHLSGTFGRVLGDLAEGGWAAEWDCVPAASVGAPHLRDRVFMLAADSAAVGRDRGSTGSSPGRRSTHGGDDGAAIPQTPDPDVVGREGERLGWVLVGAQRRDAHGLPGASLADANHQPAGPQQAAVDADVLRLAGASGGRRDRPLRGSSRGTNDEWAGRPPPEPTIRGVDDGLARQVDRDRLFVLGNGVVPQAAARAWNVLWPRLHGEPR